MPKTRAELIARAYSLAAKSSAPPGVADSALIDSVIDGKAQFLARAGVYSVEDTDAIEDEAFQWLAMLVAQDVVPDFGGQIDASAIDYATAQLRKLNHAPGVRPPVENEYF